MNKEWVLFHLKEALEAIEGTIKGIESQPDYDYPELSVEITHIYHHLNTAWNSRNCSKQEADECSESNFAKWRQFPTDVNMSC